MKIKSIAWCLVLFSAFAIVYGLMWLFARSYVASSRQSREFSLRQDLLTMRSVLSQYTLDKHKRPHSMDDFVAAGYLKQVPVDPMTGRDDTWVLKCSSDPAMPGVESIESGDGSPTRGVAGCD
jgi:general secretion pathway protein G